MNKRGIFKNHHHEIKFINQRLILSAIFMIIFVLILLIRLFHLQVIAHNRYKTLSEKNQFALIPIAPNRGLIYDRNGILLAKNMPVYSLELIPDKIPNLEKTISALQKLIQINSAQIKLFHKLLKQNNHYSPIPLKIKLTEEEVAKFYVNQYHFPGVIIQAELIRQYPFGAALSDTLGYVGRINDKELKKVDKRHYLATNYIGKVGIEKHYETALHGQAGYQQVEMNANGQIVRIVQHTPPIPGHDLYLTIDSKLELSAQKALHGQQGAIVAIDPQNGAILALVTNPSYDPNLFVQGISQKAYQALQHSPGRPLYNRAIRGQYPLASTIKPFLALEGLVSGVVTPEMVITDPGWYRVENGSHTYLDWKKGGHGRVNLNLALVVSCDTYFYHLGRLLGIDRIDKIMAEFGFGQLTHIDMGEELPGLIPSPQWKLATKGERWYLGDTLISAIGQGYMLATPLQLASATATLSTRGQGYKPHLLLAQKNAKNQMILQKIQPLTPIDIPQKHWDLVIKSMRQVIYSRYGTGHRFGRPHYKVAAKTGTGQLFSTHGSRIEQQNLPKKLRDNSMFIAFAPYDNPQIAIAVIVENDATAAPIIARKIMDAYLLEKKS